MKTYNIAAISGSLRAGSLNTQALQAARHLLPKGASLSTINYSGVPLFSGDVLAQGIPDAVSDMANTLVEADGVLIASPEYNFSFTGVLKNALDWLSKTSPQPFKGKPVAILSATTGPLGGARSQYDLRKVMGSMEAVVMPKPEIFIGMANTRFQAGVLQDEGTAQLLREQMQAFCQWIDQWKGH